MELFAYDISIHHRCCYKFNFCQRRHTSQYCWLQPKIMQGLEIYHFSAFGILLMFRGGKDICEFTFFVCFYHQMALWGNKCDLSISAGLENAQTSCPLDQVNTLQPFVLVDDLDHVWQHLRYVLQLPIIL